MFNPKNKGKFLKKFFTKISAIIIILLFLFSNLNLLNGNNNIISADGTIILRERSIVWDVRLDFEELDGKNDYAVFGEAPDANDGGEPDSYDEPKPPAPMTPYVRAWFDDNLGTPYNRLWKDYRKYPDTEKVWNLTVMWVEDYGNPTSINISWNISELDDCEYNSVTLYEGQYGGTLVEVADMLTDVNYSYFAEESIKYYFTIICETGNNPPVAVDDSYSVDEGGILGISAPGVLDNDYDNESDPLTAVLDDGPSHASSFTLNSDGSFEYVHDGSETTSDSFTYHANDGNNDSNIATVTITINPVNDPPVAVDDYISVAEGGTATLLSNGDDSVLDNDTDAEGDSLTAIKVSNPSHGSLTLNSDGTFSYTHDGGEDTSDSFTYKANDSEDDSNVATVHITISGVNDPPVAVDDSYSVAEGGSLNVAAPGVLDNDYDNESDPLTAVLDDGPSHASSFTLNSDGSFEYVHDGSETTSDSFTYHANDGSANSNIATVTITISPINNPPVADFIFEPSNPYTSDIIYFNSTSYDPDGNIVNWTWDFDDGNFGYGEFVTHQYDDDGSYDVVLTVADDEGATDSDTQTVSVSNKPPIAEDDTAATLEDTPVIIDVVENDYDTDGEIDPTTVEIVDDVNHGETSINPTTGEVTYTPDPDYYGSDSFTYTVDDDDGATSNEATVDITITTVNDPPVAINDSASTLINESVVIYVLENDYDIDGYIENTTVEIVDEPKHGEAIADPITGEITYTPFYPTRNGHSDSFNYTVKDNESATSNKGNVKITFIQQNNPPIAENDFAETLEDIPVVIDILYNDYDPDQNGTIDESSVEIINEPDHGDTTVDPATGNVTYTPYVDYYGLDSFTYRVYDNEGEPSGEATVSITITSVEDSPKFSDETPSKGSSNVPITTSTLTIIIKDPEGDIFNWSIITSLNIGNSNSSFGENNGTKSCSISGLSYSTTYTWTVRAKDWSGWTNESYSFTTQSSSDGGDPGGGGPSTPQQTPKPVANAKGPYTGFINEEIEFDGSESTASGTIENYTWDFGDGETGYGIKTTHIYDSSGSYKVILTVEDDLGATDTDETTAVIGIPNRVPTAPEINGILEGTKNTKYTYTAVSTDDDNDTIQYNFNWGDGTSNTSEFLPNATAVIFSHIWTAAGKYTISVQAYDNLTRSDITKLTVLIDAKIVGNIGYITDDDADGIFDKFHGDVDTELELKEDKYLIDSDGDGIYDYTYNSETDEYSDYQEEIIEQDYNYSVIILFITLILIVIVIIYYLKKKK